MGGLWFDERNATFLMYELFNLEDLLGKPPFEDHSKDMLDMVLNEAVKLMENEVAPTYPDEVQGKPVEATFENGVVKVPEAYHRLWKLYYEGGWTTLSESYEVGGQGFPYTLSGIVMSIFTASNMAFMMYPGLTHGAAKLIEVFGTEEQKKIFLENMYTGKWAGTMCLTEAGAGSDVGALKTTAKRNPDGTYSITGTKQFISAGDHDLTENIIHPVLARIEGDPPGTKGLSLFIVPKYKLNPDGTTSGESNDVITGNIERKLGIHGNSTCTLNFGENGNCTGYLLGQEREGIKIMFHMMNEARLEVGMQGLGHALASYLHAVDYAKERLQGPHISKMRDPTAPRVPIIQHPDVRRMLLFMKSMAEGLMALDIYTFYCFDRKETAATEEEKDKWQGIIEVLTPICKAYSSDMGFRVTETGIQVYGGYGYCREYPMEQMLRDQKISSIYEGTNGIQALDLLGRKLGMKKGAYFMGLLGETQAAIAEAKGIDELKEEAQIVENAINAVAGTALEFSKLIKSNPFVPLINAVDFLNCLGDSLLGWFHIWMAGVSYKKLNERFEAKGAKDDPAKQFELLTSDDEAAFYKGKIESAKFFIHRTTALVPAKTEILKKNEISAMNIPETGF